MYTCRSEDFGQCNILLFLSAFRSSILVYKMAGLVVWERLERAGIRLRYFLSSCHEQFVAFTATRLLESVWLPSISFYFVPRKIVNVISAGVLYQSFGMTFFRHACFTTIFSYFVAYFVGLEVSFITTFLCADVQELEARDYSTRYSLGRKMVKNYFRTAAFLCINIHKSSFISETEILDWMVSPAETNVLVNKMRTHLFAPVCYTLLDKDTISE